MSTISKPIHAITITEFAEFKKCSRQTIYNNIKKFDLTIRGKIIWNKKAEKWQPEEKKKPNKYKE